MSPGENARIIAERIAALPVPKTRHLIALAGPPAVGKSTLAEHVLKQLLSDGQAACVVPMDGFHLDNAVLETKGLLARKGAPDTFDFHGFHAVLTRLKSNDPVSFPLFDRQRDATVPDAGTVTPQDRIVLVEGNYLLLQQGVWSALAGLWSLAVFISNDIAVLEERLIQRWVDHGLSDDSARARAALNDIPNAQTVLTSQGASDLTIIN